MTGRATWRLDGRDGRTFAAFMLASLALGWGTNRLRPHPLSLEYQPRPAVAAQSSDLDLAGFQAAAAQGGVVLDARPEIFYQLGHVPGALSLPHEDFDAAFARLRVRLEGRGVAPVVVYCSDESCEDARGVQDELRQRGIPAAVFPGGWEAWTAAGLPREKGAR